MIYAPKPIHEAESAPARESDGAKAVKRASFEGLGTGFTPTPRMMLALQRSVGNAAVSRLVGTKRSAQAPPLAGGSGPEHADAEPVERSPDASAALSELIRPAAPPRDGGEGAPAGRALRRQPAPAEPPAKGADIGTGYTFELPEGKLLEFGKASYVKGSVKSEGEVQFVPVAAGGGAPPVVAGGVNQGAKIETELAKQEGVRFLNSIKFDEITETLEYELSKKQFKVNLEVAAKVKTGFPFVNGLLEGNLNFVVVEWDKPQDVTAFGVDISGGLNGEGPIKLGGVDVLVKAKVLLTGGIEPNWPRILAQAGKEGAKGAVRATATQAGTTMLAIDLAGVATSVAAIAVPAAAAVAIGYGMHQGIKNTRAAQEAAQHGVPAREKARAYAKSFARTWTGGSAEGEGGAEAERQIQEAMQKTNASRTMLVEKAKADRGYQALYKQGLDIICDRLYAEAVQVFDESHRKDFGLIEEIGETWGMRGVFRTNLRIILYEHRYS